MAFKVRRTLACRQDLEILFDHLVDSYVTLGELQEDAFERAVARLAQVEDSIDALGKAPFQGTLWPKAREGLRWTTKNRAVFYFTSDEDTQTLTVLAVFYGGQDHREHKLKRILGSL